LNNRKNDVVLKRQLADDHNLKAVAAKELYSDPDSGAQQVTPRSLVEEFKGRILRIMSRSSSTTSKSNFSLLTSALTPSTSDLIV
jgi:hypothetical protein